MKKTRAMRIDFNQIMDDSPENRETMFGWMLAYDEPYLQPGTKRLGLPFFLGVTKMRGRLAFMVGLDATTSFAYIIAEWTPWYGLKKVDLPISQIRWVRHV